MKLNQWVCVLSHSVKVFIDRPLIDSLDSSCRNGSNNQIKCQCPRLHFIPVAQAVHASCSYNSTFSPGDITDPTFCAVSVRTKMSRLNLLLVFALTMVHAQSKCRTREICKLENTRATSNASSLIQRSIIYPASCPGVCLQHAECMAATYDPETENCELHEAYADGVPCIELSAKFGSIFSMIKVPGITCPKVRHGK